jgi:hypothetical protein
MRRALIGATCGHADEKEPLGAEARCLGVHLCDGNIEDRPRTRYREPPTCVLPYSVSDPYGEASAQANINHATRIYTHARHTSAAPLPRQAGRQARMQFLPNMVAATQYIPYVRRKQPEPRRAHNVYVHVQPAKVRHMTAKAPPDAASTCADRLEGCPACC